MYTNLSDTLIKSVVNVAFPNYTGRKVQVEYGQKTFDLRSYWDSGSRNYYAIVELSTLKTLPIPQNGTVFDHMSIERFTLPIGYLVVKHCIFCGRDLGITIFCGENPILPETTNNNLDPIDYHVLIATASYKSSYAGISDYRYSELKRSKGYTLSQVNDSRTKLQGLGYLDKRNAITNNGRNVISNHPDRYHL